MESRIDIFSQLLRELEAEIGTRDVATLILNALIEATKAFKSKTPSDFCAQFEELVEVISNTEPKFGILNYHFVKLSKEFKSVLCSEMVEKKWKRTVEKRIKEILKEGRKKDEQLRQYAEKIDVEGKTILIHDHSHSVQDILVHYKGMGKHFKVIIAEQDFYKTHDNIERMYSAGIPFQVVPSYMLSHIHKQIDLLFFGALTLKDTMDFVMAPGTHSVISEFHVAHIPAYMFINTMKFSLWKSKERAGGVFIHKNMKKHFYKPIEYERIKYSHDRVPTELFSKIVTNEGIFTAKELKEFFDKQLKKYSN
ncbi:MAG: hypothetical protein ABIH78_00140 [Candidatus Peregrinibacteria bacterium]